MGNSHIEALVDHLRLVAPDFRFSPTEMEVVVQRVLPRPTQDELDMAKAILKHGVDACSGCAITFDDPPLIAQPHPACPRHAEGRSKSELLCPEHGGEMAHFQCRVCNKHIDVTDESAIAVAVLGLERLPAALEDDDDEDDNRLYMIPYLTKRERNVILGLIKEDMEAYRTVLEGAHSDAVRDRVSRRLVLLNSLATAYAEASWAGDRDPAP